MRKLASALGVALIGASAVVIAGSANVAQAQCPGADGTVPGTPARVIPVSAGGQTIYVDDRDFLDADDDGDAGGLWIYMESNNKAGLQRGGDQVAFATLAANGVNPTVPRVNPVPVPDPRGGTLITLFPNGLGGGSLSQLAGFNDDCVQAANPDRILF